MPRVLITTLLLLLSVFSTARGDYVFHTFNGVIRYSNNGERLIEYGGGAVDSSERPFDRGYWLGESVDAIAASPDGHLFASTNNLGSRSLLHFDADSGLNLTKPGDYNYDAHDYGSDYDFDFERGLWGGGPEAWISDYFEPEERCPSGGCSLVFEDSLPYGNTTIHASARLRDGMVFHPDGHLYALGIADLWESREGFFPEQGGFLSYDGLYVGSEAALIRFPLDIKRGSFSRSTVTPANRNQRLRYGN